MKKSIFPLRAKKPGEITYQHCIINKLYGNHLIVDAERNYYVDRWHEINLCAHYNFRIPGTYQFIPAYRFYVTNERCSLTLHWSQGVLDEKYIEEQYDSLEEAESSKYYQDFCDLKDIMDQYMQNMKDYDYQDLNDSKVCKQINDDENLLLYQIYMEEEKKFIQFYLNEKTDEWKVSTSLIDAVDLYRALSDFFEIEEKELRILTYYSFDEIENNPVHPYHSYYQKVLEKRNTVWEFGPLPDEWELSDG